MNLIVFYKVIMYRGVEIRTFHTCPHLNLLVQVSFEIKDFLLHKELMNKVKSRSLLCHSVSKRRMFLVIFNNPSNFTVLKYLYHCYFSACPRTSSYQIFTCPLTEMYESDKSGIGIPHPWCILSLMDIKQFWLLIKPKSLESHWRFIALYLT